VWCFYAKEAKVLVNGGEYANRFRLWRFSGGQESKYEVNSEFKINLYKNKDSCRMGVFFSD